MLAEGSKRAYLNGFAAPEKDLDQPESSADGVAVGEKFAELTGTGIGADIKIFWGLAQV